MSTDGTGRQSPLSAFFATAKGDPADGAGCRHLRAAVPRAPAPLAARRPPGADGGFTSAAANVLGFRLPTAPNTTAGKGGLLTLWLGPDEWLVVTPLDAQTSLAQSLEAALDGTHASVTDVTGGQTVITLSGPKAREVLAKGCPLDLHPAVFRPGDCAQTLLAKANVTLRCVDDSPSFELIVRRSFAEYTALWLHDAAMEYGCAIGPPR